MLNQQLKRITLLATASACAMFILNGCSTPSPKNASILRPEKGTTVNLGHYTTAVVVPFAVEGDATKKADASFGSNFAGDIAAQLRADYPTAFREVRWNRCNHQPGELVITGTITDYVPGSAELRSLIGPGVAPSKFEGCLILKDGKDDRELLKAPFSKLWAWGGMLGSNKTIEHMVSQASMSIAKSIASWKQEQSTK